MERKKFFSLNQKVEENILFCINVKIIVAIHTHEHLPSDAVKNLLKLFC